MEKNLEGQIPGEELQANDSNLTKTYDKDETDPENDRPQLLSTQSQMITFETKKASVNDTKKNQAQKHASTMPIQGHNLSFKDFEVRKELGSGSFAEVYLVKRKADKGVQGKYSALKCIDRDQITKENKVHEIIIEKEVQFSFPDKKLVNFYSWFEDKDYYYLEIEFCKNGEFAQYLKAEKQLPLDAVKFFAAECVLIQEFLHSNGIVHRDFKPENLMLDEKNHLKVIDFGTAVFFETETNQLFYKKIMSVLHSFSYKNSNDDTVYSPEKQSFVGTSLYMSPEMISESQCGFEGDFWALGVLIYQMISGKYPFDGNNLVLFDMIKNVDIKYPEDMNKDIKDLISKILVADPKERLGCGAKDKHLDMDALKKHQFFKGIDWKNLYNTESPMKQQHRNFSSGFGEEKTPQKPIILQTELVKKMKFLIFFDVRQLILYNNGILAYFNPETNEKRGEIHLKKSCVAKFKKNYTFILETHSRTFTFITYEPNAQMWVNTINKEIKRQFK